MVDRRAEIGQDGVAGYEDHVDVQSGVGGDKVAAISMFIGPGSLYTSTVAALIVVVFWVYYAALIFILGGEFGQVFELRRTRKRQRETLLD